MWGPKWEGVKTPQNRQAGDYRELQRDKIRASCVRRQDRMYCRTPIPLEKMRKCRSHRERGMEGLLLCEKGRPQWDRTRCTVGS